MCFTFQMVISEEHTTCFAKFKRQKILGMLLLIECHSLLKLMKYLFDVCKHPIQLSAH